MNEEFINDKNYTHEYSQFPKKLITKHHFKDADDSIASLINEINDLKARGLFDLADKKISENADILAHYAFGSENIRIIEEELRNVQVMAKQKHQCVYVQENKDYEPEVCCIGDIML